MELQVRKEAGGVGDYEGDWGRTLRAWESGDAGSDGGLFIKGVSGDVGEIMGGKAGSKIVLPFWGDFYNV